MQDPWFRWCVLPVMPGQPSPHLSFEVVLTEEAPRVKVPSQGLRIMRGDALYAHLFDLAPCVLVLHGSLCGGVETARDAKCY